MTLPVYKDIGTASESAPTWPTHIAGDFGILITENPGTTITTPSGWILVAGTPVINGTGNPSVLQVWYRFATSSSETAPAISATDHCWGVILTYTGVNQSNPIHSVSTHYRLSGPSTTHCPGLTTYLDDCLILALFAWHLDNAGPLSSGESNPSLSSVVERYDGGTTTGNGGGVIAIEGALATHGQIVSTAINLSSVTAVALACIALQAADKTFGIKSKIVNRGDQAMPIPVQQNAAQTVDVWMADSSDGKTGKTGLTLAVTLKKYGAGSFTSISPTVTEIGNGHYDVALVTSGGATHTDTVGVATVRATSTGADPADCSNVIDVVAYDKTSATRGTSGTALPAVASGSAGAIPTTGTGANQIAVDGSGNARADVRVMATDIIAPATIAQGVLGLVRKNTATAGGGSTITLDASASAVDSFYKNTRIVITSGTGIGQTRGYSSYVGSTKVYTVDSAWSTNPDNTSVFAIMAAGDTSLVASAASLATAQTDLTTLTGRLTSARAGYLDNLSAGAVALASALTTAQTDLTTLIGRLTSARAGYLDNLSAGAVALNATVALASALTTAQTDLTTLTGRLSSARAGYLDNLSGGAVALNATVALASALATAQTALTDLTNDVVVRRDTATAGGGSTITLDAGASSTNSFYKNTRILIVSGTGAGQVRGYSSYVGSTKVYTVDSAWTTNPDNTSVFVLEGSVGGDTSLLATAAALTTAQTAITAIQEASGIVRRGTATAGAASTITLDGSASATNDFYNNATILILSGTGALQFRNVTDYVGSTKVATVDRAWTTNPDATSVFLILAAGGSIDVDAIATASATEVWDAIGEGAATYGDLLRLMVDGVYAKASDYRTSTVEIRSLDDSKLRATITVGEAGRLAVVLGDLT